MPSSSQTTEIGKILERFLDTYEDDLSPNMFRELNDLAGEIDTEVSNLETEINELREEKESLEKEMEEE